MKTIKIFFLLMIFSFAAFAQEYQPSDFSGVLYIGEKNKPIEFTYLNNPDYGTGFYYFSDIPETVDYNRNKTQNILSFFQINEIEFFKFTANEKEKLLALCPECPLFKARITMKTPVKDFPEYVYLILEKIDWKSTTMKGFEDLRTMEARFINRINFERITR